MNALRQLVVQGPVVKIYFQSVELDSVERIDEYDQQDGFLAEAFQIKNYSSLCKNICIKELVVEYNQLG